MRIGPRYTILQKFSAGLFTTVYGYAILKVMGVYEYFSLAPRGDQEQRLQEALEVTKEIYNLALLERKHSLGNGLIIDTLEQARKITQLRKSEPRLTIVPYGTIQSLLRQIDVYTMNKHCLPDIAREKWNVIPYKDGVKALNDLQVWIPKIGEVFAAGVDRALPFRYSCVEKDGSRWLLKTKALGAPDSEAARHTL